MELSTLLPAQYLIFLPVGVVLILVVVVYAVGFGRSVEPPSFKNIQPSEEKKAIKKKKPKKAQSNGHIVVDVPKKSPETKPLKQSNKNEGKKKEAVIKSEKKGKENIEKVNKKNAKQQEKPQDFDEGEWELAPSRKDKKKKKEEEVVEGEKKKTLKKEVEEKKKPVKKEEEGNKTEPEKPVVQEKEAGETWQEAPQKKNKKKARKD